MVTVATAMRILFVFLHLFGLGLAGSAFSEWPLQYCYDDLNAYSIPPLTGDAVDDLQLLQVQTVIRHGARTPLESYCWEGYNVTWDCAVSQLESTFDKIANPDDPPALTRLYDKVYDAGQGELPNGSKCLLGNLLADGYEMEIANGRHLNKAYVGPSRLHLFESTDLTPEELREQVYLRSDDFPRTVMSGQILFNGFFPPPPEDAPPTPPVQVVPWHTQDMSQDNININPKLCPVLSDVMGAVGATPEMITLRERQAQALAEVPVGGGHSPSLHDVMDCLMSTVCAGHPTPFSVSDVQHIGALIEEEYEKQFTLEGGRVAKLGMAPLWREIRGRVRAAVAGEPVHKFVLYSGHDTTIMAMLAAVGGSAYDKAFAPYASMLNLEVYARDNGDHLFRVVYNGRELMFPGCTEALCSVDAFETALAFVEDSTPENCQRTPPPPPSSSDEVGEGDGGGDGSNSSSGESGEGSGDEEEQGRDYRKSVAAISTGTAILGLFVGIVIGRLPYLWSRGGGEGGGGKRGGVNIAYNRL